MDRLQAIHGFWASFGWPAYEETSVPDGAELPYITHEGAVSDFGRPVAQTASLWDRSTGWTTVTEKEKEIAEAITRGGRYIPYDGGALIIQRASPWAQRMSEPNDDNVRRIVLNYEVEYLDGGE